MKKYVTIVAIILALLAGISLTLPGKAIRVPDLFNRNSTDHRILAKDLLKRLATDENITLIDVRTTREFAFMHPYGAIHIPYSKLAKHLSEIPRDSLIVTLCSSGPRAEKATQQLLELGYDKVATLVGGIEALAVESWEFTPPLESINPIDHSPAEDDDDEEEDMGC